ncbi:MAG: galactosyldiacylglycerol synthase [Clostridiales bacterium]|nr:galactosyldiacylglycerol synthase [Clostridiales bacterium]PWM42437.1 MAG: galactosyldiacylglycerol synthase [Clostridiales bacterium]
MKILILSAATGGGHLRASRALQTYILENTQGNEVVIADALKEVNAILDKTCCDGYHFMATKVPRIFGRLYRATNTDTPLYSLVSRFNGAVGVRLLPLLAEEKPDVIISTHPFATEMVSHLKGKGRVSAPLICLMTDYGPHRAWIAPNVDAYVVSNEGMAAQMVVWGVPKEKIHPFGIPVEDVFFSKADKYALLQEFGLLPNLPTVLFMAGSFGVTNILSIYKDLVRSSFPFQIIIITGRNKRLYRTFKKIIPRSPKATKLVFFTDRVADYMHACDLLITKPGGLTTSEALACNIPLAVFDAIPGQEEDNANFLISHNMAIPLDSRKNCASEIVALLEDSKRLEAMRDSCGSFDKSSSSRDIFSLLNDLTGSGGKEGQA